MCSVCGCGDATIEHHHDDHDHDHDHDHHGHHHKPEPLGSGSHHYYYPPNANIVIHHHHYYGVSGASQAAHHHETDVGHHEHHHHDTAEQHHEPHIQASEHQLDYGTGEAGVHVSGVSQKRLLKIETDILDKNNQLALHNRSHFEQDEQLVLNLVSSPGSGKTTLLTETLMRVKSSRPCAVIEGDQQTSNDAERIRHTGVPAIQVNTGKGCHLDAQMVHDACHQLKLERGGLLFIENVGNLVCPASFDLGEKFKVAVLSVTEGEDKPLKYPNMFAASQLMIINKIDLLPYVSFDLETCIANAKKVNPYIQVICLSATSGEGMQAWLDWLQSH